MSAKGSTSNTQNGGVSRFSYKANGRAVRFPEEIEPRIWAGRRVLILSPHPDDDAIACGGTIALLAAAGTRQRVIYMTDGSKGGPGDPQEIAATRSREAEESLQVLGVKEWESLDREDGELLYDEGALNSLLSAYRSFSPHMVFAPSLVDGAEDHFATAVLLGNCLATTGSEAEVCSYEVWMAQVPNVLVDIGAVMEKKCDAIRCHRSQMHIVDFAEKFKGLASYRSLLSLKGARYCEAFHLYSAEEYTLEAAKAENVTLDRFMQANLNGHD